VLGGSWFLGRLIVEDFVHRGFDVTVFNRGQSAGFQSPEVRHVLGDRKSDDDLRGLSRVGPWDAIVDVSGKIPAAVRRSSNMLSHFADRCVVVSTVWAYRGWPFVTVDEDAPLRLHSSTIVPGDRGWDANTYGRLKVGCELASREAFGNDRLLILRTHVMIGQHEYSRALKWWLYRLSDGGPRLVPAPDRRFQPIDVRDVASFLVDQVQRRARGVFNVAPPHDGRTYWGMVRASALAVTANDYAAPEMVGVDEHWLLSQGVDPLSELPLWNAASRGEVIVNRAISAGLRCRPLKQTIAETWQWLGPEGTLRERDGGRFTQDGIDSALEEVLIARWRALNRLPSS
jgi:2'-hydroxyisoflavone reductase